MVIEILKDGGHWAPRRVLSLLAFVCVALLAFGLYLQHVERLEPCPMCIVQRYAYVLMAIVAGLTAICDRKGFQVMGCLLFLVLAAGGASVAARQSWLEWFPPEITSCGRDFSGIIETLPLNRIIPMVFRGTGDCAEVGWTFFGGSIANWSCLWFCGLFVVTLLLLVEARRLP